MGNLIYPGNIKISDYGGGQSIDIRVGKVESPWQGTVLFIPGNQYDKIQLK